MPMRKRTVLSMEQALSMSYATLRFVQLGWRVIRLESTPAGSTLPGDPNRYIGDVVVDDDRRGPGIRHLTTHFPDGFPRGRL